MTTSPHIFLASRLHEYISKGFVYHAQLEFPAALIPLQPAMEADDDEMIMMEFLDTVARVVYTDYQSEYTENIETEHWTLLDRHGRRVYSVLFHDVEGDVGDWVRENVILRLMLAKGNPLDAKDLESLESLVAECEIYPYERSGLM